MDSERLKKVEEIYHAVLEISSDERLSFIAKVCGFSFGCLLYEAVSKRKPFVAGSTVETLNQIINGEPEPSNISGELREIINKCLKKIARRKISNDQGSCGFTEKNKFENRRGFI